VPNVVEYTTPRLPFSEIRRAEHPRSASARSKGFVRRRRSATAPRTYRTTSSRRFRPIRMRPAGATRSRSRRNSGGATKSTVCAPRAPSRAEFFGWTRRTVPHVTLRSNSLGFGGQHARRGGAQRRRLWCKKARCDWPATVSRPQYRAAFYLQGAQVELITSA